MAAKPPHRRPPRGEDRPKTKLVVRHLPPDLTEANFRASLTAACPYEWEDEISWFYYVQGQTSDFATVALSRAYISFQTLPALFDFSDAVNGRVFPDSKGKEFVALVEYAASQKLPKSSKPRHNPKDGTIESDAAYKAFVAELLNPTPLEPVKVAAPVAEPGAVQDSPLLAELRAKIQEKRRRQNRKEAERRERERERERARKEKEKERAAKEKAARDKAASDKGRGKDKGRKDKDEKSSRAMDGVPLPRPAGDDKGSNREEKSRRGEGKHHSEKEDGDKESRRGKKERPERAVYVPKPRAPAEAGLEHGVVRIAKPPAPAHGSVSIAKPPGPPTGGEPESNVPLPKPKGGDGKQDDQAEAGKGGKSSKSGTRDSGKTDSAKGAKGSGKPKKKSSKGKGGGRGGGEGAVPVPQYQNFLN